MNQREASERVHAAAQSIMARGTWDTERPDFSLLKARGFFPAWLRWRFGCDLHMSSSNTEIVYRGATFRVDCWVRMSVKRVWSRGDTSLLIEADDTGALVTLVAYLAMRRSIRHNPPPAIKRIAK